MKPCRLVLTVVIWAWSGLLAWAELEEPRLLADIVPGEPGSGGQTVQPKLLAIEGEVWFSTIGNELWKTDGSPEGTVRVGPVDGLIFSGISLGDKVLFVQIRRNALIAVDRETLEIEELGGEFNQIQPWLYRMGDQVYFGCTFEGTLFSLCRSDGTIEGTGRISTPSGILGTPTAAVQHGNSLLALYDSASGSPMLLQVSGNETTARLVHQFSTAWSTSGGCCTTAIAIPGGAVFILTEALSSNRRYWISDGTDGGTRQLSLRDGVQYSAVETMVSLNQVFYGLINVDRSGSRRWVAGTADGIDYIFAGETPFLTTRLLPFSEKEFLAMATVSLSAEDQIWISDGTGSGPRLVHDFTGGENDGFIFSEGAVMVDDPFIVAAVTTLDSGNNSLFLEVDPRLNQAFLIGRRGSGSVSHIPVLLDENVILFADFEDYGFEPAVIRTKSVLGKIFVDSFEPEQP